MKKVYSIWKYMYFQGYTGLGVHLVDETETEYHFKLIKHDLHLRIPKTAVKFDEENDGIINIADWFDNSDVRFFFKHYGISV